MDEQHRRPGALVDVVQPNAVDGDEASDAGYESLGTAPEHTVEDNEGRRRRKG